MSQIDNLPPYLQKPDPKKDTNPKDRIGSSKLPLSLLSGTAKIEWCLAQLEGALKYGTWNWRSAGIRVSIYLDALERHLEKYKNGEDRDPDTLVHHLGSVMACAAIILDALPLGKLGDDRPPRAPVSELMDQAVDRVLHLQDLHGSKHPHHYTIEDSQWAPENSPPSTTESTMPRQRQRSSVPPETRPDERPRQLDLFERETERK